ncbi:hypothetical protein THAOC_12108 [Thalassiosira oceanica]|uniref:Uncharacterized protein n=1 Tax=Thalassiosira oceanica TaxID=159749 RepID=K0SNH0_THAOC|nr:hypothetical protein THAOC_12108 [Thalassiosira oceanica]|eukprot:EJK66920.1 hypothetical protein THAOC_12108 [Thalassiosira oceanica]
MKVSCPSQSVHSSPGWPAMQGVLLSEATKIHAQISNLEVHQPQGRHDAGPEGGSLPLAFHCYAIKVSCPSQPVHSSPGWPAMQGVLLSEVTKIHAQISNLEVHQPQGRHDAGPEGGSLPLAFHCYAMEVSCPSQPVHSSPGWPAMQGVLLSEVTKIHVKYWTYWTVLPPSVQQVIWTP